MALQRKQETPLISDIRLEMGEKGPEGKLFDSRSGMRREVQLLVQKEGQKTFLSVERTNVSLTKNIEEGLGWSERVSSSLNPVYLELSHDGLFKTYGRLLPSDAPKLADEVNSMFKDSASLRSWWKEETGQEWGSETPLPEVRKFRLK